MNSIYSSAITYLRVLALTLIVSCHFLQAANNKLAWVLNIGVHIFFYISGYIYGHRVIAMWPSWYIKRGIRIQPPLLITVLLFAIISYLLFPNSVHILSIASYFIGTQWFWGGLQGMEHLWFITAILLCYLITPLLQALRGVSHYCIAILIFYSVLEMFLIRYETKIFMPLFIYAFGYFYTNTPKRWKYGVLSFLVIICISIVYKLNWEQILDYSSKMNQAFHTYYGIAFSVFFIEIFTHIFNSVTVIKPIHLLDSHSYEIYLVHHPLILGPFSLKFSPSIVLLIILLAAYSIKRINSRTTRMLFNRIS